MLEAGSSCCETTAPRQFEFARDTFAFENQTHWEYHFDDATGRTTFSPRQPKATYAHRCFVLTRVARQFLYHARFEPAAPPVDDDACRQLIRRVVTRHPRQRCAPGEQIIIPGAANLREFSAARAQLLKEECGGAWRSFVLRSHWRMVFPISRALQSATAESLLGALRRDIPPIVHIFKFPKVTINHSLLVFGSAEKEGRVEFQAYDPNAPQAPSILYFDRSAGTFSLPRNRYWAGGPLKVIEVFRSWWM